MVKSPSLTNVSWEKAEEAVVTGPLALSHTPAKAKKAIDFPSLIRIVYESRISKEITSG